MTEKVLLLHLLRNQVFCISNVTCHSTWYIVRHCCSGVSTEVVTEVLAIVPEPEVEWLEPVIMQQ